MLKRLAIGLLLASASASLATAADLMVEPAPVEAPAPAISGDVSFWVGGIYLDDIGEDATYDGSNFGGAGRISVPVGSDLALQFDASAEKLNGVDDNPYSVWDIAGHLSWRQNGNLLGGFVSYGQDHDWWDESVATVGVEGIATMDNLQFYGQVGYTATVDGDDDIKAVYGRGEVRYFLTPNFQLTGSLGLLHQEYDGGADTIEGVNWGAALEYRFDDSPLSLFVSYVGNHEQETDEDEEWATHALMVGAKFSFGSESLQDAATNGATLRDYNPVTGYGFDRYNDFE